MVETISKDSSRVTRRSEIGAERRHKMRARLIRAARAVFARHGSDLPVVEDFIIEAGVGRGTFYNYFRTKEDILDAVLAELKDERRRDEARVRAHTDDIAERLVVAVRLRLLRARQDPVLGRLLLREAVIDPSVRKGPQSDIRQGIADGRFRLTDPEFATDLFFAIVAAGISQACGDRPVANLDMLVAASILSALGLDYAEATEIARHPLPIEDEQDAAKEPAPPTSTARRARRPRAAI